MKFKRRVPEEDRKKFPTLLNGNWMIQSLKGENFQQLIEINQNKMTFCQRKAVVEFENIKKGEIKLKGETLKY